MSSAHDSPRGDRRDLPPNHAATHDPVAAGGGASASAGAPAPAAPVVFQAVPKVPEEVSWEQIRDGIKMGLSIMRRRWWLGAIAAAACGYGVVFALTYKPVEVIAELSVMAQSQLDEILNERPRRGGIGDAEGELKNHQSVMQSRAFMQRVAKAFTPEERAAIQGPYLEPGEEPSEGGLAGLVGGLVQIKRERGRELFVIAARHREPGYALALADTFATEYRKFLQDQVRNARTTAATILRKQADELSAEINKLNNERRDYRKEFNLLNIEENQSVIAERMRRLNLAISDVRVDRVRLETQLAQAEADIEKTPTPFENTVLSSFSDINTLRVELDRLRREREVLAAQLGPRHPRMMDAERNLKGVEQNVVDAFKLALSDLKGKLELARASERQLADELTVAFNESLELDKLSARFTRLSNEITAKEAALTGLLTQIQAMEIDAQTPTDPMRVVDPVHYSGQTGFSKIIVYAGAGMVSIFAFIAVPLAFFFLSERLSGNMDLETTFKKEVLGVIPRLPKARDGERQHIVRDNVDLERVELFLGLMAQFELASKSGYPKRIVVTSTVPGEGKSTIASNLASTCTRYGRKTILVDCDFRRPVQQKLHQVPHDWGLLGWVADGCPFEDDLLAPAGALGLMVLPDGTSLIPAGGVDVQPGHVLVGREFPELFRRLSQNFDVVIVDAPPAGVFQDALIIGRYCPECIYVVREGKADNPQIKRVLAEFDRSPSRIVGLILNGSSIGSVHPSMTYRYGHGYGKYGYTDGSRYQYKSDAAGPDSLSRAPSRRRAEKPVGADAAPNHPAGSGSSKSLAAPKPKDPSAVG